MSTRLRTSAAFGLILLLSTASAFGAVCARTSRAGLSSLAEAVLHNIEVTPGAPGNSPVPLAQILSLCNQFDSIRLDGPNIYAAAKGMIALADHEVDMAFYKWEAGTDAARLIGEGLILAQARRTPADPLLVRIIIDDVEELSLGRPINHLYDSQKAWVQMGLDLSRVQLQLGTCPRFSFANANLHDKLIVVDGSRVLVTGANVEPAHNAPAPWHDSATLVVGSAGQSALAAFEDTWVSDSNHWDCSPQTLSNDCDKRLFPFPQPSRTWMPAFGASRPGDVPVLAVGRKKEQPFANNTNNPQDIAWLTAMDGAVSTIHIASPNLNDDAFRDAVVRAVGRGVTVLLIAPLGFNQITTDAPGQGGDNEEVIGDLRYRVSGTAYPERFQMRWYSFDGIEPIYGNGVRASHVKYMSIDGRIAIVGSGNMETPAWNWSHEFNLLIDDPGVTATMEATLFVPDWNRSIGSYVELYEGNNATQNLVCPVAAVSNKSSKLFNDPLNPATWTPTTLACSNDEARSALLVELPAGRVIRLYDDSGFLYQDDDWVEIRVKRAVARKVIGSFESSFEDADVRVVSHRDNGLDGKTSAIEIASSAVGPVVDLYEGNGGTQTLVCSNRVTGPRTINLTQDAYCGNDEARSLKLYDFPLDKVIFVYDNSGGSTGDDWALIVPQRAIQQATVSTFETSTLNADVRVCAFYRDNLDGKVSRVRIGDRSEAYGLCGVTPPPPTCNCGEASCRPVTAAYISHFTGAGCSGIEYYYTPYFNSDGIRRSWNGTGCTGDLLRTATVRSWKSSAGACSDSWPAGNTLSGFVQVYR